jgi:hypothetical protein
VPTARGASTASGASWADAKVEERPILAERAAAVCVIAAFAQVPRAGTP